MLLNIALRHCVKIVQIRSYFWSVFSRIRTEHTYLDTFHAVRGLQEIIVAFTSSYSNAELKKISFILFIVLRLLSLCFLFTTLTDIIKPKLSAKTLRYASLI